MPSGDYTQRRSINEIPLVTVTAIHEWNRGRHDFHFMFFRYYVTSWFLPLLLPYSMLNKCASSCPTPNNLRDARRLTLVKEKNGGRALFPSHTGRLAPPPGASLFNTCTQSNKKIYSFAVCEDDDASRVQRRQESIRRYISIAIRSA